MTLLIMVIGTERVFMATDSRSRNVATEKAEEQPVTKLTVLDGPVLCAATGYGSSIARDLFPMMLAIQRARDSAGDIDFVAEWITRLAKPINELGETIAEGLLLPRGQFIVTACGVGLDGVPVGYARDADRQETERISPGGFVRLTGSPMAT